LGNGFFSSVKCPEWLWSSPRLLFNGYWVGIKQLRHDVDHAPPSRAEVKNKRSYTPAPCICLQGMDRNSFNFDLLNGWLAHGKAKMTQPEKCRHICPK
jgi:hypothetical protein